MINIYDIIQHRSLRDTELLKVAHEDFRGEGLDFADTERNPPSCPTLPVPTAPTIPTLRSR